MTCGCRIAPHATRFSAGKNRPMNAGCSFKNARDHRKTSIPQRSHTAVVDEVRATGCEKRRLLRESLAAIPELGADHRLIGRRGFPSEIVIYNLLCTGGCVLNWTWDDLGLASGSSVEVVRRGGIENGCRAFMTLAACVGGIFLLQKVTRVTNQGSHPLNMVFGNVD